MSVPTFWQIAAPVAGLIAGIGMGLAVAVIAVGVAIYLIREFLA